MDALREEIRQLFLRHARGDIREKSFQRALVHYATELYRAVAKGRMAQGERILQEHHVVRAHMRLTQSVLKEPQQETVSLFATDRRLVRLRSTLAPGQSATCDERDETVVDEVQLDCIVGFQVHRQIRPGEICAGLAIAGVGSLFYSWLSVTGPLLIGLGVLGALHGLLLPTRWVEVKTHTTIANSILIYAVWKKSGRNLLRLLRQKARVDSHPHLATP